jgi:hypothetical protein
MRIPGWVISIALFVLVVVGALVSQAGPERLGFLPSWVWWAIVGGFLVFLGWALFSAKNRQQWRAAREAARERQRRLATFELTDPPPERTDGPGTLP